ncbi:DUF397 domain-containing protein [Streptomyces ziwulingensis]|uniref:DUF397 domain-containing protein n=1 Tax=Streptomyces ziwulingensis TaxID=1045501 RepID=A0ABP9CXH9_9ACTN
MISPQTTQALTGAQWFKSSYSGGEQACLEVAADIPGAVPVRDSKTPEGPALLFPRASFAAFVTAVGAGGFGSL